MDDIDNELHRLYEENRKYKKHPKFMLFLMGFVVINIILLLYAIESNSLIIKTVFNIITAILLTIFFVWFLYTISIKNKKC